MSSLCCVCETDIVLKLKNSSGVPINLVQGEELSEAGELVEIALDVTFRPFAHQSSLTLGLRARIDILSLTHVSFRTVT